MAIIKIKALAKLLDYTASGIGAVAGTMLAPWKASKEAEAKRITAQADADAQITKAKADASSLQIIADAQAKARQSLDAPIESGHGTLEINRDGVQQRIEFQERKRQSNIVSVVRAAADELGDKEVPNHEPDPDWTARFFDSVQDVSSEEMQKIWAKILSGEVETPGRTSLRTLSILKDMSRSDAEALVKCAEYRISSFVFLDSYKKLSGDKGGTHFVHLEEIGLTYPSMSASHTLKLGIDGECIEEYQRQLLLIEGFPETEIEIGFGIDAVIFTRPGLELAKFCEGKPNFECLSLFAKFLQENGCTLKSAPITHRTPDGRLGCARNELRIIHPAQ